MSPGTDSGVRCLIHISFELKPVRGILKRHLVGDIEILTVEEWQRQSHLRWAAPGQCTLTDAEAGLAWRLETISGEIFCRQYYWSDLQTAGTPYMPRFPMTHLFLCAECRGWCSPWVVAWSRHSRLTGAGPRVMGEAGEAGPGAHLTIIISVVCQMRGCDHLNIISDTRMW